jgi:lysophospholipase L1-like esterase
MFKVVRAVVLPLAMLFSLLVAPAARSATSLPDSMAALGDSITQAHDVCCWYGDHPAQSWSTGNRADDGVNSQYERLVALHPEITSHAANLAVSGATANGLSAQVSAALALEPAYLTLLIGANDLCTSSARTMTSTTDFATQVSASLAALHEGLPKTEIFVSSIPNIHQLWSVLHGSWVARKVWSTAGICPSMLASTNTDADRQQVVTREAAFNQILSQACEQYSRCRWDAYATYIHAFSASQISRLDYFHPNRSGQAVLAQVTWDASWWGGDQYS